MTQTQIGPSSGTAGPAGAAGRPRFARARLSSGPVLRYAEQGGPGGEPLVFLHGYSDSWFSYSLLLPLLPAGYHAYALDQRGHGDSERPAEGYAIDDFAGDVVAFLDAVGAARATVVGHSLGSMVARRVAELHPERVARLVLVGAVGTPMNAAGHELREAVRSLDEPMLPDFVREFQLSTIHAPVPEAFVERVIAESLKLPLHVWRGVADAIVAFDDTAQLGRIAAPTLLLWGERDAYFPRAEQDQLVAAIPNARLLVYPDIGHALQWECPERVAADLIAFLRGA
jgi:pimeloyl-ACP methyl ester carboxylesterase